MFKNPFSFEGRIRRLEYGLSLIIYLVAYLLSVSIASAIMATLGEVFGLLGFIVLIPTIWFVWAQSAKRCHDVGRSGWWQLIPFYVFILLFENGEAGENIY